MKSETTGVAVLGTSGSAKATMMRGSKQERIISSTYRLREFSRHSISLKLLLVCANTPPNAITITAPLAEGNGQQSTCHTCRDLRK